MNIKAIPSQLRLLSFYVESIHVDWVEDIEVAVQELVTLMDEYEIEIDFEISASPDDPAEFTIDMSLWINFEEEPLPGYEMEIGGFGIFILDGMDTLTVDEINSLKTVSGISFMIGSMRTALLNATAFGPIGSYTLPAIDLGALLAAKGKGMSKKSPAPKGNPGKKTGFKGIVR